MSNGEIIIAAIAVVIALVGSHVALIRVAVAQFTEHLKVKFAEQDKSREEGRAELQIRLGRLEEEGRTRERDHLKLLAELPMNYMRREDSIRMETVINAKLDALNSRIELLAERALNKG